MKIIRLTAAAAAAAVVAASCGGGGDDSADTTVETTTTSTTTTTVPPTTTPPTTTEAPRGPTTTIAPDAPRQPLTGDPLDDEADIVDRPALAVKIDNAPPARANHSGLAVADVVFEEIVEGDLTRFIAVFHTSDSDPVGPVRSGRSQDVDLLTSFQEPLFAWSGGNPGVRRLIRESTLVDLDAGFNGDLYYRGPGSAPHNLYSDTESLFEATPEDHPGAPPQQFRYLSAGKFEGTFITDVDLDVGQIDVQWEWDADEEAWLRSQEGDAHVDSVHGPIAFANVVLMGVEYRPSTIDVQSPEAQTVGEGPAFFLSDGKLAEGTWARLTSEAPIVFFDDTGETEVEFTPGNIWIELAERAPTGDEDDPWTVDFSFVEAP